jgi:hypothetical protein
VLVEIARDRGARMRDIAGAPGITERTAQAIVAGRLPLRWPGRRLAGFSFDGDPGMYATGEAPFLDDDSRAYKRHLAQLALEIHQAGLGAVVDRLSPIYDEIHIDEVQDRSHQVFGGPALRGYAAGEDQSDPVAAGVHLPHA